MGDDEFGVGGGVPGNAGKAFLDFSAEVWDEGAVEAGDEDALGGSGGEKGGLLAAVEEEKVRGVECEHDGFAGAGDATEEAVAPAEIGAAEFFLFLCCFARGEFEFLDLGAEEGGVGMVDEVSASGGEDGFSAEDDIGEDIVGEVREAGGFAAGFEFVVGIGEDL